MQLRWNKLYFALVISKTKPQQDQDFRIGIKFLTKELDICRLVCSAAFLSFVLFSSSTGGPVPEEQPGRVFVGEGGASAPPHRSGSIILERHISSVIEDVTDGRNEAPAEVVKQADLLRKVCLHFKLLVLIFSME